MDLEMVAEIITRWRDDVVHGLNAMRWTFIGYDRDASGAPDINKPLFAMSNPESFINAIIQE